jgi:hypothetical protein
VRSGVGIPDLGKLWLLDFRTFGDLGLGRRGVVVWGW